MSVSNAIAPHIFSPNGGWTGNDGNWSAFSVGVGTPPQYFGLFPSTSSSGIYVPDVAACAQALSWLDCGALRGIQTAAGSQSHGFQENISSTWDLLGIYLLNTSINLYGTMGMAAVYGRDTVTLLSTELQTIPRQLVGGLVTPNVWLGTLGLGSKPTSFSQVDGKIQSLLGSMKAKDMIPSSSYGYTAGASYKSSPASLIAGGYDSSAFTSSNLNFAVNDNDLIPLAITVKGFFVTNSPTGTLSASLPSSGLRMSIDSSTAQLWLPTSICDALAIALNLIYDPNTELYTVNSSTHQRLLQSNPQFTLALTTNTSSEDSTTIVLPYAAFDQRAYLPFYNVSTPYFPIRRAANESQYVLGRTFLQEAYMVVDWERRNFTLGQVIHSPASSNVVSILPKDASSGSHGLGTMQIVGLAVGLSVGVVSLVALGWFGWRFWRIRKAVPDIADAKLGTEWDQRDPPEIDSSDRYELSSDRERKHELGSAQAFELHSGRERNHELESTQVFELASSKPQELNAQRSVREMEGTQDISWSEILLGISRGR